MSIHLSIDDYKPDSLDMMEANNFSIYRMVPPKEVKYFFSINGEIGFANNQDMTGELFE